MGIVRFEIELDEPSRTYNSGSTLSGKVYLDLDSPKPSEGLNLTVYGRSKIYFKWGKQHVLVKEIHINEHKYLLGSEDGPEVLIPAGRHVYPFAFELPEGIPYTYADGVGTVKYRVNATIRRAWYLKNHRTSTDFSVVVPLDLNSDHWNAAESVVQNTTQTFMGCSDPVYTTVSLPVRGYIPGQMMPILIHIKNDAQVHIKEVHLGLIKVNLYHGTYARTRRDESLVAEQEAPVPESSETETTIQCHLKVPMTQPSFLMHSSLIDVEYLIRVEVKVGGLHLNFKIDIPVIIGSTALLTSTVAAAQGDGQRMVDIKY